MKSNQETGDAAVQSKHGVERSVNLVFIGLLVLVLLSLEIFAMSRVQTRSMIRPTKAKPVDAEMPEFEKIDFNFSHEYSDEK